jgi:hypothetical protein
MSPPYSIKEAASISGLSTKYIQRLRRVMPKLFETSSVRGKANKMLLTEEIVQVLKGVSVLKGKGKSLNEIAQSMMGGRGHVFDLSKSVQTRGKLLSKLSKLGQNSSELVQGFVPSDSDIFSLDNDGSQPVQTVVQTVQTEQGDPKMERQLRQELLFLQNEVQFLRETLRRTEERFDRLLPAAKDWGSQPQKQKNLKQILVEAVITALIAITAGAVLLSISTMMLGRA